MSAATTRMVGGIDQQNLSPLPSLAKKKNLQSTAMKRTSDWISSQEVASDIVVKAGGTSFSLHKFPLIAKCGYINKLVVEAKDPDNALIEIPDIPGGSEVFELVVKFCYGINFEITTENIAALRCAAEYLEMTEEHTAGNLASRAEAYLEEVGLMSLSSAITILHKSEDLLPMSERVKLVSRCIDAISYMACTDSSSSVSSRADNFQESLSSSSTQPKAFVDWWAEELTLLRIDTFQRVLMAMKARGFRQYALGPVIMLYAQKSLRGLDMFGRVRKQMDPKQEHEKRVVLETMVSLLPRERNAMSVSFLSMLLRAAIFLETTVACRLDLEKRMGSQLGQAVLDDLLIPSFSSNEDTMFDVDTVQRIMMNYLEHEAETNRSGYNTDCDFIPSPPRDMDRVGRLMESYLAEIASDPNLTIKKFISIAELVPEQARANEDGMYRAIDIYLKAHPSLTDIERKNLCSLMDCQKLSREACAHAAQNDRLPVQIVVQVLYYEQQRLQDVMSGGFVGSESPAFSMKSYATTNRQATDEFMHLQRENNDLKLELVRMRMQLKNADKPSAQVTPANKPPLPKKSFINTVSKKLGRLNPFPRADPSNSPAKGRTKPPKDRRHSIS